MCLRKIIMLNDKDFISQFENLTLSPSEFNHLGHLRIAWLYLTRFDQNTAERKLLQGIKQYAHYLGAQDKFHFTLTVATFHLISERIKKSGSAGFLTFVKTNPDLVNNLPKVLNEYYSDQRLHSSEATCTFVTPDKKPLKVL